MTKSHTDGMTVVVRRNGDESEHAFTVYDGEWANVDEKVDVSLGRVDCVEVNEQTLTFDSQTSEKWILGASTVVVDDSTARVRAESGTVVPVSEIDIRPNTRDESTGLLTRIRNFFRVRGSSDSVSEQTAENTEETHE
jgi:hypothetical protein